MNVFIRYAQIMLDYIEALNEYDPGNQDIRKYGDMIRSHAGDANTNNFEYKEFYKKVPFETRVFEKAFYLFPIPETEIEESKGLVQNPWW